MDIRKLEVKILLLCADSFYIYYLSKFNHYDFSKEMYHYLLISYH